MEDKLRAENHELLISLSGEVKNVSASLKEFIASSARENERIWNHITASEDKISTAVAQIADRVSNFGKPQISTIVSVCALIGSIAFAFIAPLQSNITRAEKAAETLAEAVRVKEEKLGQLKEADSEFREKQVAIRAKLEDVALNGSGLTRERLAVIENDLRWMRGEKTLNQNITKP